MHTLITSKFVCLCVCVSVYGTSVCELMCACVANVPNTARTPTARRERGAATRARARVNRAFVIVCEAAAPAAAMLWHAALGAKGSRNRYS